MRSSRPPTPQKRQQKRDSLTCWHLRFHLCRLGDGAGDATRSPAEGRGDESSASSAGDLYRV